jgi:hypothetical protein
MPDLDFATEPLNATAPLDRISLLGHPDDVLLHPDLSTAEKREILAAWASDSHAVPDRPGLRQLDSGAVVGVDAILRALRTLDGAEGEGTPPKRQAGPRRRRTLIPFIRTAFRRRDDDDDPPPTPAAAFPLGMELALRRKWEQGQDAEPLAA